MVYCTECGKEGTLYNIVRMRIIGKSLSIRFSKSRKNIANYICETCLGKEFRKMIDFKHSVQIKLGDLNVK